MAIRYARLATALLATTALGIGVLEIGANLAARAQLRQLVQRNAGLTVDGIFAEPLTGRLTLTGVRTVQNGREMTIGTLRLPLEGYGFVSSAHAGPFGDAQKALSGGGKGNGGAGDSAGKGGSDVPDAAPEDTPAPQATPAPNATPAPPAPSVGTLPDPSQSAPAAGGSGTAVAENVTISNDGTTYRIARITLSGTTLSNADLANLIDTANGMPWEARLKKLNAATIDVPEVQIEGPMPSAPGGERRVTLSHIKFTNVNAGKFATGTIEATTFAIKDNSASTTGSVGQVQIVGADLAQAAHVFNTVRTNDAEPALPIYESITVNGIKAVDEKGDVQVNFGMLRETGVKARPLRSDLLIQAQKRPLTKDEQSVLGLEMARAFEIGSIEITDMSARNGKDKATVSLGSFTMKGYAKAHFGGLAVRAFHVDAPNAKFDLGSFDLGAFEMPIPQTGGSMQQAISAVPTSLKLDMADIRLDADTNNSDPSAPKHVNMTLAHAGFAADGSAGDIPRTTNFKLDHLVVLVPPGSPQTKVFNDLGYSQLDVSMGLATTYDPATQALKFQHLTFDGVDIGSAALGVHLINVNKGLVSGNQEIVKASALSILLKGLSLDVVNKGFFERFISLSARNGNTDVAKVKAFMTDFCLNQLPAMANNSNNAKAIGAAAAKFIADPKTFHIAIESKSGLGVGSMALLSDPGLLLDTLDVKVSAND